MGNINWSRVILGGLVAGVIIDKNVTVLSPKTRESSAMQRRWTCSGQP
jgi:hypothetical protein